MLKAPPAPVEKLPVKKRVVPHLVTPVVVADVVRQKPLAIIQTGALGDIINVLPVAKAVHDDTGLKPVLLVADRFKSVFARISYVTPMIWKGHDSDAKGAAAMIGERHKSVACMLWLRLNDRHLTDNFLKEHWALLGYENQWGKLPVIFDQRDAAEEEKVLACFENETQGPFILTALGGHTSPVPDKEWVRRVVTKAACGMPVVDVTEFRCKNPIDMVALMEKASLFITSDSSPVHINRATKTPVILLGRSVENRWYLSDCVENVKAAFTYDTLAQKEHELLAEIDRLLGGNPQASSSVVTGFDPAFGPVGGVCYASIEKFAPRSIQHNFELFQESERNPAWGKIGTLLRRLSVATPGSWVIWIDADCIVNRWPPFDAILGRTEKDMVFIQDWNGICTGVWAVKNCAWSLNFLNALNLCGDVTDHTDPRFSPDGPKWEQNAVKALFADFPELLKHVAYWPKDMVSDTPERDLEKKFSIHHFGTGTPEQKLNRMRCVSPEATIAPTPAPVIEVKASVATPEHAAPQRYTFNAARYAQNAGPVKYEDDLRVMMDEGSLNPGDTSRFDFFCLAADMIAQDKVPGDFAEVGVYRGHTAAVLGRLAQRLDRMIYLCDTFAGWDARDLVGQDKSVRPEFEDTSLYMVQKRLAAAGVYRVEYLKGRFPETVSQVPADARFALVHLDCDLELPTLAGLKFFYPRLSPGGFIAVHDYLSMYWPGVQNAVDEFRKTIPEAFVPMPDASGTVVIRKGRA